MTVADAAVTDYSSITEMKGVEGLKSKTKTMAKLKDYLPLYLMMIPGLAYLIINNYIPMFGIVVAFKKFNVVDGIYGSPWNGIKNIGSGFLQGLVGNLLGGNIGVAGEGVVLDNV